MSPVSTRAPVDPDGLMEFSVVFTERSLNHMSKAFQGVMCDLDALLCEVYKAKGVAIVPGGGTFGMEAVARQFGGNAHAMIVRNGWFSYRWSQILTRAISLPKPQFTRPARSETTAAHRLHRPRSTRSRPPFGTQSPTSYLRPTLKPVRVLFCRTITSLRLQKRRMTLARCWFWIALRRAVRGLIWRQRVWMC